MIDPYTLGLLPRDHPLPIRSRARGFQCVICGAMQEPDSWRVKLPGEHGQACPNCASDHGWTVR